MPAAGSTQAKTPTAWAGRNRATDTHGPYECGEFRVLRVGGIVALHFGTPAGRIIVHVRERSFVKHARAEADDQGNRFRSLFEIDAARVAPSESESEGERVGVQEPAKRPLPALCDFAAGWEFFTHNLHLRAVDVSDRFGFDVKKFHNWIHREHRGELRHLRRVAHIRRPSRPSRRAA